MGAQDDVTTFLTKAAAVFKTEKVEEIAALYDDNATYISVGMPPAIGKKDILAKVYGVDPIPELKGAAYTYAPANTHEEGGLIFQVGTYTYGPIKGNYAVTFKRTGGDLKYFGEAYAVELM